MSATVRCPTIRPIIAGLAVAILIAATTFETDHAQAQAFRGRGPWCTAYFDGPCYTCSFYSWEQCWATASGVSNQCILNPFYVPAGPPVVRRSRIKHR